MQMDIESEAITWRSLLQRIYISHTICKRMGNYILWVQTIISDNLLINKRIIIPRDIINIFHYCSWAVDEDKYASQQFLNPPL